MSTRTMTDNILRLIDIELSQINTILPAKIIEYDPEEKKASVQPMIKRKLFTNEVISFPAISGVPVMFPSSKNFVFHFPLNEGDTVLLVFSQRSLDEFLGTGRESLPGDRRKFDLSDAVCLPGLFPFSSPGLVGTNNDIEIIYKDSKVTIEEEGKIRVDGSDEIVITGAKDVIVNGDGVKINSDSDMEIDSGAAVKVNSSSNIELNGSTKDFVTHAELDLALQSFLATLNTHTHVASSFGAPTTPPAPSMSIDISSAKTNTIKTGG